MTYPNVKGQVGVYYSGVNPPTNTSLLWKQIDINTNFLFWKEYRNGVWTPIGNYTVIDNLISLLTTEPLSANQGRILDGKVTANANSIAGVLADLVNYVQVANKNIPGGWVELNAQGFVPDQFINVSAFTPKGDWDPNSGAPPSANPQAGWIYSISDDGNFPLSATAPQEEGDFVYYDGADWIKMKGFNPLLTSLLNDPSTNKAATSLAAKLLKDLIDSLTSDVNDNASAINALSTLVSALQAANTALTNALATKQNIIKRLPAGTITAEKYTHADLAGIQYGQLEVIVNGTNYHVPGFFTKTTADNFISIPGESDGAHIQVKIYPL
mgnify:CR=1 FL=1